MSLMFLIHVLVTLGYHLKEHVKHKAKMTQYHTENYYNS